MKSYLDDPVKPNYVEACNYIYRTFKDQMLAEQAYWFQQASEVGPSRKNT